MSAIQFSCIFHCFLLGICIYSSMAGSVAFFKCTKPHSIKDAVMPCGGNCSNQMELIPRTDSTSSKSTFQSSTKSITTTGRMSTDNFLQSTSSPVTTSVTTEDSQNNGMFDETSPEVPSMMSNTGRMSTGNFLQSTSSPITTAITTEVATTTQPCPLNQVFADCVCQGTCEDPHGWFGCHINCTGGRTCVCPAGFLLLGQNCIPESACGCYHETGGVIPNGGSYVTMACTETCSCENNVLVCINYTCSEHAMCQNYNGNMSCECNVNYMGNGTVCKRVQDCQDLYDNGVISEGFHLIYPLTWQGEPFEAYCKDGWTFFQLRVDNKGFYDNWDRYRSGLYRRGTISHWLGNDRLANLTAQRNYTMRMEFKKRSNNITHYLQYDLFRIGSEVNNYALEELGSYTGSLEYDYMGYHRGSEFSTYDSDNDNDTSRDCVKDHHLGGWWYNGYNDELTCTTANFNGNFGYGWDYGVCIYDRERMISDCDIATTEMKIKPL
ncbi:uncharacterized protein [Apostichopus japonicus]|uniref:uncharacterized protein isoform X2 n=1 Tax=Stichopus japonicus TaxID=307972 RepID=UPI003AB262DB